MSKKKTATLKKRSILTEEMLRVRLMPITDFESITPAAAELLAVEGNHKNRVWDDLDEDSLEWLKNISNEVAVNLGRSKAWNTLDLNGLDSLSDEAAEAVAKFKGREISLNGLSLLSDMVAEALAKFKGVELSLNGLGSLSDKAAEALSKFKGAKLSLNGLSSLSEKGTEALSRVMLKARKDAWGQFECEELCLNGLTTLTDKGAEALSKCKAVLFLNGIKSLSDAAAKVLTGHRGTVKLCGLNELSDQGALSFSMNKSIEVSDQLAKQIANAVKNHAQTSSTLTSKDQSKIRKLITSQGADNVDFACNLLASLNASEGDWLKLFPKTRIFKLLSNWEESKIWNTLATAMKPHARLYEELKLQAKKRVNTNSYDGEVRWRYERFLDDLVKVANDDVVDVLKFARPDRVKKKKSSSSAD